MREDDPHGLIGELLRYGVVESVDLAVGKCTVRVGEIVTQPIRWLHGASGATRSWSPPSVGEQVLLLAPEGDIAGAIALRGVHSTSHPPAGDSTRELLHFADGAVLSYDPETHALAASLPAGATVSISADGGITLAGPVTIAGDVSVEGDIALTGKLTADDDVVGDGISLARHIHGHVAAGAAKSGPPE